MPNLANYLTDIEHHQAKMLFEETIKHEDVAGLENKIIETIKDFDMNKKIQFIMTLIYEFKNIMYTPIAWMKNAFKTATACQEIAHKLYDKINQSNENLH